MPKGGIRPRATCHPERVNYARGLCANCYRSKVYAPKHRDELNRRNKEWAAKNPDKRKAIVKRWIGKNIQKVRARSKRWYWKHVDAARLAIRQKYQENKEQRLEYARRYAKIHPEKKRASEAKRRAAKKGKTSFASSEQREWRAILFGYQCAYCGAAYEHIDHLTALAVGGDDDPDNLVPSCGRCNHSKRITNWKEWYHRQAFYSKEREKFIEENCK